MAKTERSRRPGSFELTHLVRPLGRIRYRNSRVQSDRGCDRDVIATPSDLPALSAPPDVVTAVGTSVANHPIGPLAVSVAFHTLGIAQGSPLSETERVGISRLSARILLTYEQVGRELRPECCRDDGRSTRVLPLRS